MIPRSYYRDLALQLNFIEGAAPENGLRGADPSEKRMVGHYWLRNPALGLMFRTTLWLPDVAANLQLSTPFSVRLDGTNVNWYVGTNRLALNNIQVQ
jgi:hypothetical protein